MVMFQRWCFSFAVDSFAVQGWCLLDSASNHHCLLPNSQARFAFPYFLANRGTPSPMGNWSLWRSRIKWRCRIGNEVCGKFYLKQTLWLSGWSFFPSWGICGMLKNAWCFFEYFRIVFHPEHKPMMNIVSSTNRVGANHHVVAITHWNNLWVLFLRTLEFLCFCLLPNRRLKKEDAQGIVLLDIERIGLRMLVVYSSQFSALSSVCALKRTNATHDHCQ